MGREVPLPCDVLLLLAAARAQGCCSAGWGGREVSQLPPCSWHSWLALAPSLPAPLTPPYCQHSRLLNPSAPTPATHPHLLNPSAPTPTPPAPHAELRDEAPPPDDAPQEVKDAYQQRRRLIKRVSTFRRDGMEYSDSLDGIDEIDLGASESGNGDALRRQQRRAALQAKWVRGWAGVDGGG